MLDEPRTADGLEEQPELRRRIATLEAGAALHERAIRNLFATVIEWAEAVEQRRR